MDGEKASFFYIVDRLHIHMSGVFDICNCQRKRALCLCFLASVVLRKHCEMTELLLAKACEQKEGTLERLAHISQLHTPPCFFKRGT